MKLYDFELSGNAYRIRLMLALLGLKYESVPLKLMQGEQRQPEFLKLNPRGQVPTLDDDGTVVWDSLAILVYLARKYGGEKWLPLDAEGMAEVMQWLAVMENEVLYGLARARVICKFKRPGNLEEVQLWGARDSTCSSSGWRRTRGSYSTGRRSPTSDVFPTSRSHPRAKSRSMTIPACAIGSSGSRRYRDSSACQESDS